MALSGIEVSMASTGEKLRVPSSYNSNTAFVEKVMEQVFPWDQVVLLVGTANINKSLMTGEPWRNEGRTEVLLFKEPGEGITFGMVSAHYSSPRTMKRAKEVRRDFGLVSPELDPMRVLPPLPKYLHEALAQPVDTGEAFRVVHGLTMRISWLAPVYCMRCYTLTSVWGTEVHGWNSLQQNRGVCRRCQDHREGTPLGSSRNKRSKRTVFVCGCCEHSVDFREHNARPQSVQRGGHDYTEVYCSECSVKYGDNFTGC